MISTHSRQDGNQTHDPFSSHRERERLAPAALLSEGATTLRVAGAAPVMAELKKEGL